MQRAEKRQAEDVERDLKLKSDLETVKSVASGELLPSTITSHDDAPVIVNNSETSSSSHVIDMEIGEDELIGDDDQLMVQERDRSVEEDRAAAYQSRVAAADSFNTFQFWREPVPSIVFPELTSKQEIKSSPEVVPIVENESTEAKEEAVKPEEIDLPHENEFEDDEDEMEIEPLFGDDEDYDESRVEELHKLENHLKRVLDKGNKEMDHLTQELSEARLGSQTGGNFMIQSFFYPNPVLHQNSPLFAP